MVTSKSSLSPSLRAILQRFHAAPRCVLALRRLAPSTITTTSPSSRPALEHGMQLLSKVYDDFDCPRSWREVRHEPAQPR